MINKNNDTIIQTSDSDYWIHRALWMRAWSNRRNLYSQGCRAQAAPRPTTALCFHIRPGPLGAQVDENHVFSHTSGPRRLPGRRTPGVFTYVQAKAAPRRRKPCVFTFVRAQVAPRLMNTACLHISTGPGGAHVDDNHAFPRTSGPRRRPGRRTACVFT